MGWATELWDNPTKELITIKDMMLGELQKAGAVVSDCTQEKASFSFTLKDPLEKKDTKYTLEQVEMLADGYWDTGNAIQITGGEFGWEIVKNNPCSDDMSVGMQGHAYDHTNSITIRILETFNERSRQKHKIEQTKLQKDMTETGKSVHNGLNQNIKQGVLLTTAKRNISKKNLLAAKA